MKFFKDDAVKCCTQHVNKCDKSAVATGLEKVSFHSNTKKKGNPKECSNYCTTTFISHVGKDTLEILQARLLQYVNQEHPNDTSWVSKRNKKSNCQHSLDGGESKGISEKHLLH